MLLSDIYKVDKYRKHMCELKALFKVQKIIDNFEILITEFVLSLLQAQMQLPVAHGGGGQGHFGLGNEVTLPGQKVKL